MTVRFFNGRQLTDAELVLHGRELCIACGQPAHKWKDRVDLECAACWKSRNNYATGALDRRAPDPSTMAWRRPVKEGPNG